ncbi:MAG: hypothetical protein LBN37_00180 [Bacteroidales bacterium]|jgi:hypothetical protein|nr:hypothetical protein [Bacteroidales bacterium]
MITPSQIFDATHGGLDIIRFYYPNADEKKPFRVRDERTPSSRMKRFGEVWKVTDFGDDSVGRNAIDICMREENINFPQAVYMLAGRYGITDNTIWEANKPEIRYIDAADGEAAGNFDMETKDFTERELKTLGHGVKVEHCKEYGFVSLAWYSLVREKEGAMKKTIIRSTDTFPIFAHECHYIDEKQQKQTFYKILKPVAFDKKDRFMYLGKKPANFINGLDELKTAVKDFEADEPESIEDIENDERRSNPKRKKFPEAVICSGERDALCCRAMGYRPLWFNSETINLPENDYRQIAAMVETVYNVPDIDETGIRKGVELGMKYIDIRTVWLPDDLRTYRDQRGRPRKDLRDFCELHPNWQEFKGLLNTAMPMQFWEKIKTKDGGLRNEINNEYVLHFLHHSGFGYLESVSAKGEKVFVKVDSNVVRKVVPADMKNYLRNFLIQRNFSIELRNLVNNSKRLSPESYERFGFLPLNFKDFEHDRQYMFFQNGTWEITADRIAVFPKTSASFIDRHVWDTEIIAHDVRLLPPAFEITRDDGADLWDIAVKHTDSKIFKYLINTSRIYWRQELEQRLSDYDGDTEQYRTDHQFAIAGELLTADETAEQKQHLVNKIFAIGYLMHRYKSESRPWLVFAMDYNINMEDANDYKGGTGKSFFFKILKQFMPSVTLNGAKYDLLQQNHTFERVSEHTDIIVIDDARHGFDLPQLLSMTTETMTVNPKIKTSFELSYAESPKFGLSSNGVPSKISESVFRRLLFVVFSDWYHEKTVYNDYERTWQIRDDFNMNLFGDLYPETDWNADINFLAQCCRFYLSTVNQSVKISPPLTQVMQRIQLANMTNGFHDWAIVYFAKENDTDNLHIDRMIEKQVAYQDFLDNSGQKKDRWTPQKFRESLQSFCRQYGYRLNPKEYLNGQGRIIRKCEGKTVEMIYIQTAAEIDAAELSKQSYDGQGTPF